MKKFFVFCMLIVAIAANAQTVPQDKEELAALQIIDKVYDKTTEAITQLADALAVPAEHVYNVLVKQQIITGVSLLLGMLLSILISCIFWLIVFKKHDFEKDWIYQNTEGWWTATIILNITSIVLIVIFIVDGLPCLINPEYGAIREIMSIL